jgi:hypothetical protein
MSAQCASWGNLLNAWEALIRSKGWGTPYKQPAFSFARFKAIKQDAIAYSQ